MPEFDFSPTAWISDGPIQFHFKEKYLNTNKVINILLYFSLLWKKISIQYSMVMHQHDELNPCKI